MLSFLAAMESCSTHQLEASGRLDKVHDKIRTSIEVIDPNEANIESDDPLDEISDSGAPVHQGGANGELGSVLNGPPDHDKTANLTDPSRELDSLVGGARHSRKTTNTGAASVGSDGVSGPISGSVNTGGFNGGSEE